MDKISLTLVSLFFLALVLYLSPNIFALNRGKILRNIALWLMIAFGLALVYKVIEPLSAEKTLTPQQAAPQTSSTSEETPVQEDEGQDGYAPPGE